MLRLEGDILLQRSNNLWIISELLMCLSKLTGHFICFIPANTDQKLLHFFLPFFSLAVHSRVSLCLTITFYDECRYKPQHERPLPIYKMTTFYQIQSWRVYTAKKYSALFSVESFPALKSVSKKILLRPRL